jgi:hypothetical protein
MKKLTQRKKSKKIMKGGSKENIIFTLLMNSIISYLPTTDTVKSESKIRDYLSSVDAITLLEIIGSDEKYMTSKSLKYLIDSIDRNTMEIIKNMGDSLKIPGVKKDLDMFDIDCYRLSKKTTVKELLELPNYLLDCNDELCNRNLNWYDIVLGFRKLDDEYEQLVRDEIIKKKIIINTNKSLTAREKLRKNEKVREIMKRRLMNCSKDPRSFFDKLKGSVSWIDYNHCTSCQTDDCILYIDGNYKSFLMMDLGISSVKKLKILIFIEIRIYLLSKYLFIESLRLDQERKRKVKKMVEKIYRNDYKNGRIINVKDDINRMIGGDNSSPLFGESPTPSQGLDIGLSPGSPLSSNIGPPPRSPLSSNTEISPVNEMNNSPTEKTTPPPETQPVGNPQTYSIENASEINRNNKPEKFNYTEEEEEDEELVLYLTYNILKPITEISPIKNNIINALKRITHIDAGDIMIGNPDGTDPGFRKGFCTYSFEVTIAKQTDSKESFSSIKENVSDAIKDGSFQDIMNIDGKISLRDIYFKGIGSMFDDNYRMRYKRGIVEIGLEYPKGGHEDKMKFSKEVKLIIYDAINSLFDEFNLSKKRVQLEIISAVDNDNSLILVQFMIMDSYSKLESAYTIANTINDNLTRIVGDKIEEINMTDKCYIFDIDAVCNASTKKIIDDNIKNVGIKKDNIVVVNSNCQDIVSNLRNNYVSNSFITENCNEVINKELGITEK